MHLSEGFDGVGILEGQLTPIGYTTVKTVLDRIEAELFDTDWNQARARLGREPSVDELERTAAQRRHDALVEMAVRAETAPKDGKRPLPLVSVLVDFDLLAGRVCELAHTTTDRVISPGTVTKLFQQPEGVLIERVVFDPPSRQISDLSHQRLYTGGLRRVIQLRDRACAWPGCTVPAEHCQLDHVTPWHKGGPTTQPNGQLLCGYHHRLKDGPPPHQEPQTRSDQPDTEPPQAA